MKQITFYVKQRKEVVEALTGLVTANSYVISDTSDHLMAEAKEIGGAISRNVLGALRPFKMDVTDRDGNYLMFLVKKFAFLFHRMEVNDENKRPIGAIQGRFALIDKTYTVEDASKRTLFEISSPFFSPWTYNIRQGGVQKGVIKKKWSGFFKEVLTDADNFAVTFPETWDGNTRSLLMAACILIDFIHFEN